MITAADDQLQQGSESGVAAAAVADSSQQANLNRYRLHLYNYALQAERLRLSGGWGAVCPVYPAAAAAIYQPRFPVSLFHPGAGSAGAGLQPADEPKPQHSYIGLIAMAILGSTEGKLVLSDIYQYILDNYPYFRTRGPGWRNSIRHNLSLNDCFVKAGRSANGKGHYWAIHPANVDDFKKGDFRRRKAQRKVRRHMGLAVDDDGNDSPSPPPPPPPPPPTLQQQHHHLHHHVQHHHLQQQSQQHLHHQQRSPPALWQSAAAGHPHHPFYFQPVVPQPTAAVLQQQQQQLQQQSGALLVPARAQKRQFDVASLLAPDPPKRMLQQLHRSDPMAALTATGNSAGAASSDDDDETMTCGSRNGNGGGVWEPAGLLQRYYEQQLQAAHRLHAFRQSLGLQRMIGGGPWPAVIVQDRNQTPTPPSLQPYADATTPTPDDSVCKTELVD